MLIPLRRLIDEQNERMMVWLLFRLNINDLQFSFSNFYRLIMVFEFLTRHTVTLEESKAVATLSVVAHFHNRRCFLD